VASTGTYRSLDPQKVIETISALQQRITERFPGAGLGGVCAELNAIAQHNSERAEAIGRRNIPLRVFFVALVVGGLWLLTHVAFLVSLPSTTADTGVCETIRGRASMRRRPLRRS